MNAKIIAFPGQEQAVAEEVEAQALTREQMFREFVETDVHQFVERFDGLFGMEGDQFFDEVEQLRNILTHWLTHRGDA